MSRNRSAPVVTFRSIGSDSAADVTDVAMDVGEHDVLGIELPLADGFEELLRGFRHHHLVTLLHHAGHLDERRSPDQRSTLLEVWFTDHRAEVGVESGLDGGLFAFDRDVEQLHFHGLPLTVVFILELFLEADFHFIHVSGVGATGGERPADLLVVPDRQER